MTTTDTFVAATAPTVSLLGLGGCGTNLVRKIMTMESSDGRTIKDLVSFQNYLDSSRANIRDGETVAVIANGNGSGKIRRTNAAEIVQTIAQLGDPILGDCDITVLVFGASGGTGSVIGPVLMRELTRRKRKVVVVLATDNRSSIDCENTLACLKTINHMVTQDDLYLPVIVRGITDDRDETDHYLCDQTAGLVEMLTLDAIEVDRNDRLNWLNAKATVGASAGMHPVHVSSTIRTGSSGSLDHQNPAVAADSALYLGVVSERDGKTYRNYQPSSVSCERFRKEGELLTSTVAMTGLVMANSADLNTIIDRIEDAQSVYRAQPTSDNTVSNRLSTDASTADASGLIF